MYGKEKKKNAGAVWREILKKRDHLKDISVDGKMLKCILKKQDGKV